MSIITDFLLGGWAKQLIFASFVTISLAIAAYIIGLIVALIFTIAKLFKVTAVTFVCNIYTTIFRGVPELLVILFFFYTFSNFSRDINTFFSLSINSIIISFVAAAIALGLITGSYLTEVFRGGLSAIQAGQIEAAEALGMPKLVVVFRIIFPQLISYTWQPIVNIWLSTIKDTSLVAIIGISELMFTSNLGVTTTGQPFIFYSFGAILYLTMMLISNLIFKKLSYKYNYLLKSSR